MLQREAGREVPTIPKSLANSGYHFGTAARGIRTRSRLVLEDVVNHEFDARELTLLKGDTRQSLAALRSNSHDLVITSPPYLNSFDYCDVYRPELFVGGFVNSNMELRAIRIQTIRSHVQSEMV